MTQQTKPAERDREATERRLVATIGEMVAREGFERIGINAVATRSGVSKILIYRYFGSVEGLMAAYIRQHDYWINTPEQTPSSEQLPAYIKQMFRAQAEQLRNDVTLRRLCRWELSSTNEMIDRLREERERRGIERIAAVCRITGRSQAEVAPIATLLSAAITYLMMLSEQFPRYNAIPLDQEQGWEQINRTMDSLIDLWFAQGKT